MASSSSSNVSGMAASIRNAVESETFDLAGQNVTTIHHTIHDAFDAPWPLEEMIRITLVTGAGKLGRQKYDEHAAKAVTTALREVGFQEDRAASGVMECAGTFKLQHDTGKNLKTVVVFPKVITSSSTSTQQQSSSSNNNNHSNTKDNPLAAFSGLNIHNSNSGDGSSLSSSAASSLLPGLTNEQWKALTTSSSKTVFEKMMESRCPSWVQKRQCLQYLDQIKHQIEELDQKLCKGTVLTDAEQDFYDNVSTPSLEEKQTVVRDQMHHLVEKGQITSDEKRLLLSQVSERIDALSKEIDQTPAATTNKMKLEKLNAMKTKAMERKVLLDKIISQPPHALRQEAEIRKLRKELQPLLALEASTKGRLMTIKETQTLARKDEILQEITELENASRGWFEDDALFAARVQASRYAWNAAVKQIAKKKPANSNTTSTSSSRSGGGNNNSNAWSTNKPAVRAAAKPAAAAAKPKSASQRGGSVFAAMMMDSDSE